MSTRKTSGKIVEPKRTSAGSAGGKASKAFAEETFTDEERAAMRSLVQERKAAARRGSAATKAEGEKDLFAAIAKMPVADRNMAKRVHAIVMAGAPNLLPKTWYGMPAYANDSGQVVCFFQAAQKFKTRYATFGFSDKAKLDDGNLWPTAFALKELTPRDEARITELLKTAVG